MSVTESFQSSSTYRLKRRIGGGGCAEVYLYSRQAPGLPDQDVALKVLKVDDEATAKELVNEGLRLGRLKHPNILTTFGYEKISGSRFGLVLEYIPGHNLKAVSEKMSADMRPEVGAYVIRVVAEALAAAHHQGVIHGDVSARNVLVSEGGLIKLSDFGLAERADRCRADAARGSADYLAPERWKGGRVSTATDAFSLGILGYELITGTNPLRGKTLEESKQNLGVFLARSPWRGLGPWGPFFEGALHPVPENRLRPRELLDLMPSPRRSALDLQKELASCVLTAVGESRQGHTQRITRTLTEFVFKRSGPGLFACRSLAAVAFALFLAVPAATGMDHGVSGFLRLYQLTLTSDPWGEVFIDGVSKGYTPLLNLAVSSGSHEISWRSAGGIVVKRSLMAFPNGAAAFKIINKKGRSVAIAPILNH